MTKLYECVADLQGGEFQVGSIRTAKEWKEWALFDREYGDDEYTYKVIKKTPLNKVVPLIEAIWGIEIKERK